jgi:hypothetical protein
VIELLALTERTEEKSFLVNVKPPAVETPPGTDSAELLSVNVLMLLLNERIVVPAYVMSHEPRASESTVPNAG